MSLILLLLVTTWWVHLLNQWILMRNNTWLLFKTQTTISQIILFNLLTNPNLMALSLTDFKTQIQWAKMICGINLMREMRKFSSIMKWWRQQMILQATTRSFRVNSVNQGGQFNLKLRKGDVQIKEIIVRLHLLLLSKMKMKVHLIPHQILLKKVNSAMMNKSKKEMLIPNLIYKYLNTFLTNSFLLIHWKLSLTSLRLLW